MSLVLETGHPPIMSFARLSLFVLSTEDRSNLDWSVKVIPGPRSSESSLRVSFDLDMDMVAWYKRFTLVTCKYPMSRRTSRHGGLHCEHGRDIPMKMSSPEVTLFNWNRLPKGLSPPRGEYVKTHWIAALIGESRGGERRVLRKTIINEGNVRCLAWLACVPTPVQSVYKVHGKATNAFMRSLCLHFRRWRQKV